MGDHLPEQTTTHLQQDLLLQVPVGSVQQLFGAKDTVPHHVLSPAPRKRGANLVGQGFSYSNEVAAMKLRDSATVYSMTLEQDSLGFSYMQEELTYQRERML